MTFKNRFSGGFVLIYKIVDLLINLAYNSVYALCKTNIIRINAMQNDLLWKAILSGIAFGSWPFLIQKSGLTGSSVALFCGFIALLFVTPFAVADGISFIGPKWWVVIIMGAIVATGSLLFNDMMVKAKPASAGLLFITMLVVQVAVPSVYHVVESHHLSLKTLAGFVAAMIACVLLSSK
jgi:hypothetical protein